MLDVVIAGAGPAGAVAGLLLARAGARVLIVDRDQFPRDKLCGDTLNPGAVGLLASIGLDGGPLATARPLTGMLVSGPRVAIRTQYPPGRTGLAVRRRDLDAWLLDAAIRAGARFEAGLVVRQPLACDRRGPTGVGGVVLARRSNGPQPPGRWRVVPGDPTRGSEMRVPAVMTVAADGRRSALARALSLTWHPPAPRRWAFGVYTAGVGHTGDVGEMHIRPGRYLGIAPLTADLANVCLVTVPRAGAGRPLDVIRQAIHSEPQLASRFATAEFVGDVRVLGPLAVEASAAGVPGLLMAGDAAGFVDPMTGDGLHLALQSAVLAAEEILRVLATGDVSAAPAHLALARRRVLGPKLRFNRTLRLLVSSPAAIGAAQMSAAVMPGLLRRVVRYAGDAA
jgi:flavin-dependent dehydrogenase